MHDKNSTSSDQKLRGSKRPESLSPLSGVAAELDSLREAGLWRECIESESPSGPTIRIRGHAGGKSREYLHLCSNNYLDLARDERVIEASCRAAQRWGAGSGAARLVTGTSRLAVELERELADFKQAEAAALFSSGYLANLGLVQALAGPSDLLLCDQLNHASLIDAARLARAEVVVYPHGDAEAVAKLLERAPANRRKFVLTDGVFSMDGDVAPLARLNELALEYGAWLVVDDAHGTGVIGPHGRGACAAAGVAGDHVIQIITLSKALGSQGGAVVGARAVVDLVVNRARSFIFETALAPPALGAALEALRIVREDDALRESLHANVSAIRNALRDSGFEFPDSPTPIIPLLLGGNDRALRIAEQLKDRGYWITAIRPPTVPEGTARLRITVMASHRAEDLERFALDAAEVVARVAGDQADDDCAASTQPKLPAEQSPR